MASRSSAYFHLLSSYFLALAAALEAWTCGPLGREAEQRTQDVSRGARRQEVLARSSFDLFRLKRGSRKQEVDGRRLGGRGESRADASDQRSVIGSLIRSKSVASVHVIRLSSAHQTEEPVAAEGEGEEEEGSQVRVRDGVTAASRMLRASVSPTTKAAKPRPRRLHHQSGHGGGGRSRLHPPGQQLRHFLHHLLPEKTAAVLERLVPGRHRSEGV